MSNAATNDSCEVGLAKDPWSALAGAVFVYGAGDPNATTNYPPKVTEIVALPGSMFFHGLLEAPNSTLDLTGTNACIGGGLAAGAVNIQGNANFSWDPVADTVFGNSKRTFYRTAWSNCTVKGYNASFPMDGC